MKRFNHCSVFVLLAFSCLTSACFAGSVPQENQPEFPERWLGVLNVGVVKLRLSLELQQTEDAWHGEMISLDQGNSRLKMDSLEISESDFTFAIKAIDVKYSGKFNDKHNVVEGTFTQMGQSFPLEFQTVESIPERKHVETLQGEMTAGPQKFKFQIRIFESDGKREAVLDSFSESLMGLNIELEESKSHFNFEVPISNAKYFGERSTDGKTIIGKWKQNGGEFDLTLTIVPLDETDDGNRDRPQTPKPPFAYDSEDILVDCGTHKLSGTLTFPKANGPFPTIILVSGSGPQDRDETLFNHKPFAVWADHLTNHGYAVFRYDERGVGKSTGKYAEATTRDFANDVEQIVDHLKTIERVDAKRMSIMGHSEGGMVAPMVAEKRTDIAAIVLLAGPSVPGTQILVNQSRAIAEASGVPVAIVDQQIELLQKVLSDEGFLPKSDSNSDSESFLEKIMDQIGEQISGDPTSLLRQQINTPWQSFFLKYDPSGPLRKIKIPVLALFGERDLQVTPSLNVDPMREALIAAGNKKFEIKVLPELNHLFQKCKTGSPNEYAQIEETLNISALEAVTDWLDESLKK
ncbi:MAG: alpha/beta hydrolase [Pirellulaceae bacterium]